jgi:hypothetical protein
VASAADPWLVKIEPGIYDVQASTVVMSPWVDIEGSGEKVTKITAFAPGAATVQGAADAELREITVEHTAAPSGGYGLRNDGDRFSAHRVTALAFDSGTFNTAILNLGDDVEMSFITARAEGGPVSGIGNSGERTRWRCIRVFARGAGIVYALFNWQDGEFTDIVAEAESTSAFAGAIRNEGARRPIMRQIRAHAKGATIGQAITNGGGSNAQLYDVVATAVGSSDFAVGVSNQFGRPTLTNVDVRAKGVGAAYGVASLHGSVTTLTNVTAVGMASGSGVGLLSDESTSIVHRSTLKGDLYSVETRLPPSATVIGASQLDGPVSGSRVRCVGSYDRVFRPLTATCR